MRWERAFLTSVDTQPTGGWTKREKYVMQLKAGWMASESGGIGRRARLRIWSRKGWGFESPLSHQPYRGA